MHVSDSENLTESIWNDYTISQLPTLENNLENVITEDLMDADIVDEQLLHQVDNETAVAVLQPVSIENEETLMVTCRCCNKNFSFYDLQLHIAEKSNSDGYYGCDKCTEIFLLKEDLEEHILTHKAPPKKDDPQHECTHCSFKFSDAESLQEHKKIHLPFRCSYCVEDFVDITDLQSHVNDLHSTKRVKTDFADKAENKVENKEESNGSQTQKKAPEVETTKKVVNELVRCFRICLKHFCIIQ